MHEIEVNRNSHLIDPHLQFWGWEVPVYLFLGGLAAGIMTFSALLVLRRGTDDHRRYPPRNRAGLAGCLVPAVSCLP